MIDLENSASAKLARKLGYSNYAQADFRGEKVDLFERSAGLLS